MKIIFEIFYVKDTHLNTHKETQTLSLTHTHFVTQTHMLTFQSVVIHKNMTPLENLINIHFSPTRTFQQYFERLYF